MEWGILVPRSMNARFIVCWSWDLIVDNPSAFSEGLASVRKLHRLGQLQAIFIVYRHNEAGLPPEIEPMEFVKHGLEDHGLRSHAEWHYFKLVL